MTKYFTLTTSEKIVPHDGESVAEMLVKAAMEADHRLGSQPNALSRIARTHVAQIYYLAADAYRCAAGVSLGHTRADGYERQAQGCILRAEQLTADVDG